MNKTTFFTIITIIALLVVGLHVATVPVDAQDQAQTAFVGNGNLFFETSAQLCDSVSSSDNGVSDCFNRK